MQPQAPPDLHIADHLPDGCSIGPPGDLPPAVRAAAFGPPEGIRMRLMLVPFEVEEMQRVMQPTAQTPIVHPLTVYITSAFGLAVVVWVNSRFGSWWAIAAVVGLFFVAAVVFFGAYEAAAFRRNRHRRRANRANPEMRGHGSWFDFYVSLGHLVAATGGRVCAWCGEDVSGKPYRGRCPTCQRTYDHASLAAFWGFDSTGQWVGPVRAGLLVEVPNPAPEAQSANPSA